MCVLYLSICCNNKISSIECLNGVVVVIVVVERSKILNIICY